MVATAVAKLLDNASFEQWTADGALREYVTKREAELPERVE